MKTLNYRKFKQLAHQRLVWILLFSILQLYSTISLIHTQKHTLVHDHQCKICLTNFNHTPFVLSSNLSFTPTIQESFIVEQPHIEVITVDKITAGNRDPPLA